MARKGSMDSVIEAVKYEMRQDKNMIWIFELTPPVASTPGKPVINLEKEFGRKRVVNTGIDENWMAGCVLGAGLAGSKAVTYIPYQGNCMCFQMLQNHAGKLRSMTGGDAEMPVVFILEMTGQTPGFAGQHSDYEIDTYYAHIPGLKTVIPSTPTDAKGMMVSAIRDPNPVAFLWADGLRSMIEDVPDEQYMTPLDKAAVRTEGTDITIVGAGGGMPEVVKATEQLQKAGMKVETIDLRSLKPMDTETLVTSVRKTKRLLTVDQLTTSVPAPRLSRGWRRTSTVRAISAWPSLTRRRRPRPRCSCGCGRMPPTSWTPPRSLSADTTTPVDPQAGGGCKSAPGLRPPPESNTSGERRGNGSRSARVRGLHELRQPKHSPHGHTLGVLAP